MKKCSKTLLGLALAAAMSLSLIVPASAVYCPHDYYASTAVWYTDDGPRLQTRHWQMTIRCHNCGYADAEKEHTFPVRLELPEGWSWETVSDDGDSKTEGIRFYKTDDTTVSYTLLCWTGGYGICGTGVTSEEITLANGMKVWQHTEENTEKGIMVMADISFEDVPGSYVAAPSDTMTTEVWNANRDALLSILGTAQIGRKSVSQQAAIDAAKAQYTGEYDEVYATYDVTAGAWTVSFSKAAAGAKTDRLVVDAAGKVMAAGK